MPGQSMIMKRIIVSLIVSLSAFSLPAFSGAGEILLVLSSGEPEYMQIAEGFGGTFTGGFREINLEGSDKRQRELGEELSALKPDVVVVVGNLAAQMVELYPDDFNIVYCNAVLAARSTIENQNAVGVYHESDPADQISFIKELFPGKKRVGVLYSTQYARIDRKILEEKAVDLGIGLDIVGLDSVKKVPAEVRELIPNVDLLWVFTDPVVFNSMSIQYIVLQSFSSGVPIFCGDSGLARKGATAALVPDPEDVGRMAAHEAQQVLEGSELTPGSVVYAKGKLVLNKKIASLLELSFPPSLHDRTVEIIQ